MTLSLFELVQKMALAKELCIFAGPTEIPLAHLLEANILLGFFELVLPFRIFIGRRQISKKLQNIPFNMKTLHYFALWLEVCHKLSCKISGSSGLAQSYQSLL